MFSTQFWLTAGMASFVQKGALAYDGEGFHGFCRTKIRGFVRQMLHRRESLCVLRKTDIVYAPGKTPDDIDISGKSLTVSLASQTKDIVPALMMAKATVAGNSLKLSFENKTAIIGIKNPKMSTASQAYTGIAVTGTGINTEVVFGVNAGGALEVTYQTPGRIIKAVDSSSDADKKTTETVYIAACPLSSAADLTFTASNGEPFTKTVLYDSDFLCSSCRSSGRIWGQQ